MISATPNFVHEVVKLYVAQKVCRMVDRKKTGGKTID